MKIDTTQVVLQMANFGILLYFLTKFMYRPILKIMEARAKKIQEGLEAAEKSLEDQAKANEKRKDMFLKTEQDAAKLLDQARLDAKAAAKDIVAIAKTDAREAIKKEYKILESKLKEEERKARKNIAGLVADATSSILQKELSTKQQKEIIKNQIKNLSQLKN